MRETLPRGGHGLYDRMVARQLRAFYTRIAKMQPDDGRVVDVGCGPGQMAAALHQHLPHAEVVGIDLDPIQIRRAQRNAPHVDFRVGDSRNLPFEDGSIDRILTSESFHHWEGQDVALAEIHRSLAPGGECWIIEGAGDQDKAELAAWTGKRPWPGKLALARFVFRTHGYTTEALHAQVLPVVAASPFGGCDVERLDGWWILRLRRA